MPHPGPPNKLILLVIWKLYLQYMKEYGTIPTKMKLDYSPSTDSEG